MQKKVGFMYISPEGLRKLADSLEAIYSKKYTNSLALGVWEDETTHPNGEKILFFQVAEGTGCINLFQK